MSFSEDNAILYLKGLKGDALRKSETYVRRAHKQVMTKIRRRIENELGWTCEAT
jgi:hypothetical protein